MRAFTSTVHTMRQINRKKDIPFEEKKPHHCDGLLCFSFVVWR